MPSFDTVLLQAPAHPAISSCYRATLNNTVTAEAFVRRIPTAIFLIIVSIIALGVIAVKVEGPAMLTTILSLFIKVPKPEDVYPHAPLMPPVVKAPIDNLLSQYEAFLKAKVPAVFAALQPGLTNSQIDAIETKYRLKLPPDLRALYLWRDGTPRTASVQAFPSQEFVPLELALANRDELRKQFKAATPVQQQVYITYLVKLRGSWVGLIVDAAGDGYFFDPGRFESEGSFFFCFAEDGNYVFYPSFRNYLAAVVEGEKAGVFVAGKFGVDTADFAKAQELWSRYGAQRAR